MLRTDDDTVLLSPEDYAVLGESDFGMPGLQATESIGPFVELQESGPLIMVHDALVEPRMGIAHHPHRFNERLFYILHGALDHDDALNHITGHMGPGDLGRLTEGRAGMYHKEWNNTDERTRAFILVYATDPVPERASFAALRDEEAPRYNDGSGVRTKELIGPESPLEVHGDIRFYADSLLEGDARLDVRAAADETAMLVPLDGAFRVGDTKLEPPQILVVPSAGAERTVEIAADGAGRLLRVLHGAGRGPVLGQPHPR